MIRSKKPGKGWAYERRARKPILALPMALIICAIALFGMRMAPQPSGDDFETALALWKEAGMPIPPATAVPIRSGDSILGLADEVRSEDCTLYSGGYVFPNALGGYTRETIPWKDLLKERRVIEYTDVMTENARFQELGLVAIAIQAGALGHRDVTEAIVNHKRFREYGSDPWLGEPKDGSLTALCAMAIYAHCVNELTHPKSDRSKLIKTLEMLSSRRLIVKSTEYIRDNRGPKDFLEGLRLANKPSRAKPGSAQAAVDDLVNVRRCFDYVGKPSFDAVCKKAIGFGLDAVPALAELLSSKQLSRAFLSGLNRRSSQILTVDVIAKAILLEIAQGDLGKDTPLTKQRVLKWYEAKRAGKVEDWLMAHLFRTSDGSTYCNPDTFAAIGTRYTGLLRRAYREVRKAGVHDGIAIRAIAESDLPKYEIQALLVFAAQGEDLDRLGVAPALHKFHRREYDNLLLRQYVKIPKSFDENYADIPSYALGSDDIEVWDLVAKKIGEADNAMKMALLASLSGTWDAIRPIYRKRAVALLRKYFDDSSRPKEWKTNEKFRRKTHFVGDEAPTIGQVALRAAAFASGILYVNVPEHISAAEWKEIRKKIEAGTIIEHDSD